MAVKGQISKNEIAQEILKCFGSKAFLYNDGKEIRINWTEEGEATQVKLVLTASKIIVSQSDETVEPGISAPTAIPKAERIEFGAAAAPQPVLEPTAEEKQTVADLIKKLGL